MKQSQRFYSKNLIADQRGQALTEFLMMSLVLIPLFLLIPLIGKYQEISHATQMASRYAAWDATLNNPSTAGWKSESQLAKEIRRRFFSSIDAPIKTGDVAGNSETYRNKAWTTPAGKPLIENFETVTVSFGGNRQAQHAQGFLASGHAQNVFNRANFALVGAKTIDLESRGIYRVNIRVPLANLPDHIELTKPFNQLNLVMNRHTSLLLDPWAARSPAMVDDRTQKWAPIGKLLGSGVEDLVGAAIRVIDLDEVNPPEFARLENWRDVVPVDRLLPNH